MSLFHLLAGHFLNVHDRTRTEWVNKLVANTPLRVTTVAANSRIYVTPHEAGVELEGDEGGEWKWEDEEVLRLPMRGRRG